MAVSEKKNRKYATCVLTHQQKYAKIPYVFEIVGQCGAIASVELFLPILS